MNTTLPVLFFNKSDGFYHWETPDPHFPFILSSNDTASIKNGTAQFIIRICNTPYCITNTVLISIISILGIITNFIVMLVVLRDRRLHQPTFVTIAMLSLSDFTFLLPRYIRYLMDGYLILYMTMEEYRITRNVFDFIGLVGGGASVFHVVLISVVRYFIIVHPLKTHAVLTCRYVILISIALWVVAIGNASFYFYAVIINKTDIALQITTNKVVTIFMTVFPVVVIIILHVLKSKALLQSLSTTEETVRKMSRVITIVICSYLITSTPSNVFDIASFVLSYEAINSKVFYHLRQVGRLFLFVNYSINPFIYFIFSPQFKRYFTEKWKKRPRISHLSKSQTWTENSSGQSTKMTDLGVPKKNYKSVPVSENSKRK